MLLALQLNNLLGDPPVLVTVPDVVGQSQASGTADLEALLFVVAVATAYSGIVPFGDIISQSPAAGIDAVEGSTVTITVSLGEAPVVTTEATGGFYFDSAHEVYLRRKRREKERKDREEAEALEEPVTQEIAKILKAQEAKDIEREDLKRIQALADKYAGSKMKAAGVSTQVRAAVLKAHEERTFNALQQLSRVLDQAQEDEEVAILMLILAQDD